MCVFVCVCMFVFVCVFVCVFVFAFVFLRAFMCVCVCVCVSTHALFQLHAVHVGTFVHARYTHMFIKSLQYSVDTNHVDM